MAKAMGERLDQFIEKLECLNQDDEFPVKNAFADGDEELASDRSVDAELLVKIEFRQPVKLSAISIQAGADPKARLETVKIFQGKPNMDFQEAAEEEPTQVMEMSAEALINGESQSVRFVKFQCVQTLQLFFGATDDREATCIKRIQFLGEPAQKMDMKDWKPVKG